MTNYLYRDNINTALVTTRLKKLCSKAGFKSVNSLVPEEMRGIAKVFLEKFLERIAIITLYYKKKTISLNNVYQATENYLLLGKKDIPKCKDIDTKIKICLEFPKAPFKRLIKEILQDLGHFEMKIETRAADLIQYYTERHLLKALQGAKIASTNAKRETLYPRDLKSVEKILD